MSVLTEALDLVTGVPGAIGTEVVSLAVNDTARSLWTKIRRALRRADVDPPAATISALEGGDAVPVDELVRVLALLATPTLAAIVTEARTTFGVNVATATDSSVVVVGGDVAGRDIRK